MTRNTLFLGSRTTLFLVGIAVGTAPLFIAQYSLARDDDIRNPPEAVQRIIDDLGDKGNKAVIVRTKFGPWLVAAATADASPKCLKGMEHDNAVRAAVVEAKRTMGEKLSAEIETLTEAIRRPLNSAINTEVRVRVAGQVLSRVQLLEQNYDDQSKRARVVIASAPLGESIGEPVVFADADSAAKRLLERASLRLCSPGVMCARLAGSSPKKPVLAFIAIAIAPRAANGQHEVSNAKAQAMLKKFWSEQLDSLAILKQGVIPDPDDPIGSRLLNCEHFSIWAQNHTAGKLPGFRSENLDRDQVSYTAVWCTN